MSLAFDSHSSWYHSYGEEVAEYVGVDIVYPRCVGSKTIAHLHSCPSEVQYYGYVILEGEVIAGPSEMSETIMIA